MTVEMAPMLKGNMDGAQDTYLVLNRVCTRVRTLNLTWGGVADPKSLRRSGSTLIWSWQSD